MADITIKHNGAFITPSRLRVLAFEGSFEDRTDRERELRVALQDALVLGTIFKDGRWTECRTEHGAIQYVEVDRDSKWRAALKKALGIAEHQASALDNLDGGHMAKRERIAKLRKEFGLE